MKLKKLFFTLLTLTLSAFSYGQNYNMFNGNISDCGGTFYDTGGSGGSYSNNETIVFTICPDTPGSFVTVDFTSFDIEDSYEMFTVYDGNSTSAVSLGSYTGTAGPGFVSATSSNTSGCLTFEFTSDGSVTYPGWVGIIGCTQPCQDVIANASFSPAQDGDGVIRLCQGQTLNMNGTGAYPENNTGYTQSDATSTFEWSVDGAILNGQNVSHTFPNAGAYYVQLEITDIEGCSNANDIDQVVYVSTTPIFAGTAGAPDPICLGEQADFTGVVNPVTFDHVCNQPSFPPISLPDGSGVSYQTSVNLDCYASGQQLTDINDLQTLCVTMEHSYMGDLEIEIECPSGQSVILVDYPNGGGSTYLGVPVDNDAQPSDQGTGYQYCWDPNATNGTWSDNSGGTLPSGSYESDNPLSDLVGCDLNGDWTLIITDNLGSDNGFIFDWSLNFDPSIIPPAFSFTPLIVSDGWQADPTIVGGTNPITVEPTSTGNACYTYIVTDDFGCTYDTTVCITIDPSPVIDTIADITGCNPITLPNITGTDLTGNEAYYTGSGGTGTQYNPGDIISTTTTFYIYDEQTVAPFCSDEETFEVTIANAILTMNCPGALTAVCDISEQPAYGNFTDFVNAGGSASTTAGANVLPATFTLVSEVSDNNTCPETITRTYQIEDDCGNSETCTQTITVEDNINPTGTAPADVSVQCIGDVPAADPILITDEADNCATPTVTHVGDVSDNGSCPETITRTYRIEDDCGNFLEVDQIITVNDNINPTGTAPAPVAVQCVGDVPASDPTLIIDEADNCATPTVTHVGDVSDNGSCPETITRTYRIEDDCGNFIEVDQIITVNDDIAPTASNPASTTVECVTDVPATDPAVVIDEADNCTVTPIVTFISETSNNNVCDGEQLTRTYEIADDCGNTTTVTHTIIIDSYTPSFTVAGTDPTVCGGNDGFITISGLDPLTDYTFEFNGGAQTTITTDGAGEYVVTGLSTGSYTGFTVGDVNCPACSTTDGQTVSIVDPNAPAIDAGVDQQVCDGTAVTLTAINPDGAIISWNNGVTDGVAFTPGVGTVTYTVTADQGGCINTDQVTVTVYAAPTIDVLANQEECDSYTLPDITGTDLTGNEAYYDAPNGAGTQFNAGDVINTAGTTTLYIYDETGTTPNCSDEQMFDVTINLTPVIDPLANQVVCDSYTLPAITGINLTGNEAYYTGAGGTGTQLNAGNVFTTAGATTLYIYDETGTIPNCSDEQTFDVTINLTPIIDVLADQEECDSYTLPAITGTNLTGSEAYFDAPNGGGTQLNAGDAIIAAGTTTLYIYDETATTPNCSDEQTFDVTINLTPVIDPLADQEECDSYMLPVITGTDLTGNEAYYDAPNGGGTQYNAGDAITASGTTTLYIYDATGTTPNCSDEQTFDVTINITPTFGLASTDPTACGVGDGTITISGLEPNTVYEVTYSDGSTPVGPNAMNSDAAGDIVLGGLTAGSYYDFVVTLNGCTATDNSSINLVDPNAPAVNAGTDQVVCEGEDVTLTANNPDGANISWDNGVTDGITFSPAVGTVNYTVTADLLGCISTDQVEVTVNPLPNVNAGNDLVICDGDQVILTGSGADSYTWDNGVVDGQLFTPDATTTYTVTGSTLGCENTDDLVVTVVENPIVLFEADTTIGCVPVTVNFSNLTQGSIDNCTYTFGDGTVLSGCDITHTFVQTGCYDVTLEVENSTGCISTTTIQDYICVKNYPIANFSFKPGQLSNVYNQADFTNSSIGGSYYDWSFGDGETTSDINPSHTFNTESGEEEYEVTLITTNEYGCKDTVSTVIPVIEELIFYVPNTFTPDSDNFNETFKPIFTSGFDPQDYTLLIFNRWGEIIFESHDSDIGWDGTYGVESNEIIREGTYVWKIEFKTKYTDERKVEVGHVNILR